MRGWLMFAGGLVAVVLGAVWTLQGAGVLGGSLMSGVTLWAVVGPIVAIAGLVLLALGFRARR